MSKKKRSKHSKRGAGQGYLPDGSTPADGGLLRNLSGMLGARPSEQFILGALLGAAAAYVLGDEQLRGKLLKAGVGLYANFAGGFEEMKEQMADIKAEIQAERQSAA